MYLPEKGYRRIMVLTFYFVLGGAILYFFFKYLFVGLLPFLIGWLIARMLQKPVCFLHKKAHLPTKPVSVVLVLLVVTFIIGILYLIFARLYAETVALTAALPAFLSHLPDLGNQIFKYFEGLFRNVPYIDVSETFSSLFDNLDDILINVIQVFTPTLTVVLKSTVTAVPYTIIFVIITIVATCYITMDYEKINSFIKAQLPARVLELVTEFKEQFFETTFKYFKAYSIIILITFSELFLGFTLMGNRYSFVLAVIVAIIDVLPVLGTGTVLIPWFIINFITGDIRNGIYVLVLYGVITVVRQVIEPKIVGSYIGLYPVLTLLCMYVGVRLMGMAGLFVFPILAIIIKNLNDKGVIHVYKNPPHDSTADAKLKFLKFKKHDKHR